MNKGGDAQAPPSISQDSSAYSAGGESTLIDSGEPSPYAVLNSESKAPFLIVCDHASNRIPIALNNLGLSEESRQRHIAWDIGAGAVARQLASDMDATAVLANYSRLVVDCNRQPDDESAFQSVSDGELIPGNTDLDHAERARRAEQVFWPYHDAIAVELSRIALAGQITAPALISIHSFTPVYQEFERPWEIGVLWDRDPRIACPLMAALKANGICVGDNQPYSGRHPHDFTVDHHAELARLPYVSLEIRQDLVQEPEGQRLWAKRVADCLGPILADDGLYRFLGDAAVRTGA